MARRPFDAEQRTGRISGSVRPSSEEGIAGRRSTTPLLVGLLSRKPTGVVSSSRLHELGASIWTVLWAAVDERTVPAEVEARVAEGEETVKIDQLPGDGVVDRADEGSGGRDRAILGEEGGECAEEVAFGSGADECGEDALAHDIADDHVEAAIIDAHKIGEIAVHVFGGCVEHGDFDAVQAGWGAPAQEGLLDAGLDLVSVMLGLGDGLFGGFPVADVFDHAPDVLLAVGSGDEKAVEQNGHAGAVFSARTHLAGP